MESDLLIDLVKLMVINIVLSGDNAIVIALACRNLPAEQQKKAVFWGSFGAIGLRIVLTVAAVWLLKIPLLQVIGSLMLLYIAVKLLISDGEEEQVRSGNSLKEAIKTIIIADLVMSLDNVLAVAGAANGNILLIGLGLAISVPLIIWASKLLMVIMNRFPIIVWAGAALLGYTAGEMILNDHAVGHHIEEAFPVGHIAIPVTMAVIVLLVGKLMNSIKADLKRRELSKL
ncbi:TerC family protein [Paenibacillus glycanilyticus]|uniref:TerC family protein n=1 Tax=Paenibacillus glycanilyticus TaxID=126569 RepID=UPI00191081DD|nr:TerC family protein [Paenibacillus glycanilyticus]